MRDFKNRRYWLVGASEGLGRAVAERLSAEGAELVLSARSRDTLEGIAADLSGPATVVEIDISDDASVGRAAAEVGEIDGLVLLAGAYWPVKATEWDAAAVVTMADVNFTGFLRVLGHVVPQMVAKGAGHIVMTSSLTAFRGLPGSIGYTASKAGIMSLAECMVCDLRGTGVAVQLLNPGFIKTRLTDKNDFAMPFIMEPGRAADIYVAHMKTARFQRSFPRVFSYVFRLARFLPDALHFRLFGASNG